MGADRNFPLRLLVVALLLGIPGHPLQAQPHWTAGNMTDAGPHPRIALVPEDVPLVRSRLEREPYAGFFRRIHDLALLEHDLDDHEVTPERRRAETARAAAYLVYLDRTVDASGLIVPFPSEAERVALGDKAATYLLNMYTSSRAKGLDATLDIHTAQELHLWAETLDLLLGADLDVLGNDRAQAIQNVADLAADFYADFEIVNWWMLRSMVNNHRSKSAAALGMAAMALNGEAFLATVPDRRYEPAAWIDFAIRYTDLVLRDTLSDPEGGYQESGSYLSYSGIDHVPFVRAWHRYTGGASYDVDWDDLPEPRSFRFHASGSYRVPDLWIDPWLERQALWGVRLLLPDGTLPPFDDCTPGSRFFYGALVQPHRALAPLFRWAWERQGQYASGSVSPLPLLLVTYDDGVQAAGPEAMGLGRHQALPLAGQVVFRSSWEPDAVYTLLSCEHGKAAGWARTRWGDYVDGAAGHEHPDGASFMLHAYGEPLALDGGYLGWPNHAKVHKPQNHNIVLVDGRGPEIYQTISPDLIFDDEGEIGIGNLEREAGYAGARDGMAYLVHHDLDNPLGVFAEITTRYHVNVPDTAIRRRATFLWDRFLVLQDRIRTTGDAAEHTYTVQIHGNGGGTSEGAFALLPDGARWSRDQASLRAVVRGDHPVILGTRESIHDAGHWEERTHTTLDASQVASGGDEVGFLTVLVPSPQPPTAHHEVTVLPWDGPGPCVAWETPEIRCEAWSGFPHGVVADPEGAPLFEADTGGFCRSATALAGTFAGLTGDPESLVSARFDLDPMTGAPTSYRLQIHAHGADLDRAELDLPVVSGSVLDGACSATTSGDRWRIAAPATGVLQTVPDTDSPRSVTAAIRMADVAFGDPNVAPLGETVTLEAHESCTTAGSDPTYRWTLARRPELSAVEVDPEVAADPTLTLQPDLPGYYRVELTTSHGVEEARATLGFEVEGERGWDGGVDAGTPPDTPGGGCGCATRRGTPLFAWFPVLFLLLGWRRAQRIRRASQPPTAQKPVDPGGQ